MDITVYKTDWISSREELHRHIIEVVKPDLGEKSVILISEKVIAFAYGAYLPLQSIQVSTLARLAAAYVRPVGNSRGLSVPEKMQYVRDKIGTPRFILACAVAAIARPFYKITGFKSLKGLFYRIAGDISVYLDGGRPPYEDMLLPPLGMKTITAFYRDLGEITKNSCIISDINDRGGRIRHHNVENMSDSELFELLKDNPLQQGLAMTPLGILNLDNEFDQSSYFS